MHLSIAEVNQRPTSFQVYGSATVVVEVVKTLENVCNIQRRVRCVRNQVEQVRIVIFQRFVTVDAVLNLSVQVGCVRANCVGVSSVTELALRDFVRQTRLQRRDVSVVAVDLRLQTVHRTNTSGFLSFNV